MLTLISTLFFGALSGFLYLAAALFTIFVIVMIATLLSSWRDPEWSLKERLAFTALLSFMIAWGSFLTYYAVSWARYFIPGF